MDWRKEVGLAAWSAWLVLGLEWVSRGSLTEMLGWVARHPLSFIGATLVVAGLLLLLRGLIGHGQIAFWALTAVGLTLAFISGSVLRILGRPVLPGDLALMREAGGVARWQELASLSTVVGLVVCVGGGYLLAHRLLKPGVLSGRRHRLLMMAGGAALVLLVGLILPGRLDPVETIRTEGLLLTELRALRGDTAVAAVTAPLPVVETPPADEPEPGPEAEPLKPNILLVLSESLWDPTLLPGTTFDPDPMAFFHQLQQSNPHGWLLSPEYGGNTANVELEVLTGLSRQFFPVGTIPYRQYIKKPTDSLASILARQGYRTTAITPWQHWFFRSNEVYPRMGFSKFIPVEFYPTGIKGDYMSDAETAKMIIEESRSAAGPWFIFANTSENHTAYYVGKFPENTVEVTGAPPEVTGILETYAEGTKRADEMLRTLVTHFEAQPEPTMIVWFGDHLPALGPQYQSYKATGYIAGVDDPQFLEKIHRVPMLVWTNYQPAVAEEVRFGTNYLGPYLLREAGLAASPFMDYLWGLKDRVPAIPPRRYWEEWKLPLEDLAQYEALQQDIVFGEQRFYGDLKDRIMDPNFVIGHGPMVVDRVEAGAPGLSVVRGQNLPRRGVVYAGGKPVKTRWLSLAELEAELPPGTYPIEVRVLDDEGTLVVKSDQVSVTIP